MFQTKTATSLDADLGLSQKGLIAIYGFLTIALLVPIWIGTYFPSQNGPEYFLFVHMVKEFNNSDYNYSEYYEFLALVVPNLLFHILVYLLAYIFPIAIATKLILSFCVILLPVSVFYLVCTIDTRKILLGFAVFPYAYNHFIPKGYNSFYLSLPLFFFFFGYLIKHIDRLNLKKLVALTILIFFIYLSHMFSFLFAFFIVAIYLVCRGCSVKRLLSVLTIFVPSLLFFYPLCLFHHKPIAQLGWCCGKKV